MCIRDSRIDLNRDRLTIERDNKGLQREDIAIERERNAIEIEKKRMELELKSAERHMEEDIHTRRVSTDVAAKNGTLSTKGADGLNFDLNDNEFKIDGL